MGSVSRHNEQSTAMSMSGSSTPRGVYRRGSPSMPRTMGYPSGRPMGTTSCFNPIEKASLTCTGNYRASLESKMMAAPVKWSPDGKSLETGTPAALFPVRIAGGPVSAFNKQQYAVSPDGQRFLVNLAADEAAASPITLILNWKPKP